MLFDLLPRLCGMIEEELVHLDDFCEAGGAWRRDVPPLPLKCCNAALLQAVQEWREEEREEGKGDNTRSIAHHVSYWTDWFDLSD